MVKIPLLVIKNLHCKALATAINNGDSDIVFGVLMDLYNYEVVSKAKDKVQDRMSLLEKVLINEKSKPYLISFA